MAAVKNISKKRKFVADGVFYSELNEVVYILKLNLQLKTYTFCSYFQDNLQKMVMLV
jgi:hypothetical protein